jgi:hypothetical protein
MIDQLRTHSARLITRHSLGPVALQVRAWVWLTAETDDLAEKVRCLEAIVALDPQYPCAQVALQGMRERLVREN